MDIAENLFVIDAETDGIYGNVLSIAVKVMDNFVEKDRFYGAVKIEISDIKNDWVKDNVFDGLKNADVFYDSEDELLEAFWSFYIKYYDRCTVIADVPYPVEMGIFKKCILKNQKEREKYSPFPLYDLESMLIARGYEKRTDRMKLAGLKLKAHDAMNDVDATAKILEVIFYGKY